MKKQPISGRLMFEPGELAKFKRLNKKIARLLIYKKAGELDNYYIADYKQFSFGIPKGE